MMNEKPKSEGSQPGADAPQTGPDAPKAERAEPEALSERDLFLGLVQSFQAAAMQQMGKVMNPFTEKIERDLGQAKLSIEMLEMLRTRTTGNLTGQEARFLNHVLTELRLNFVAEKGRDEESPGRAEGNAGPSGKTESSGKPQSSGKPGE
jgi:hypothetical protein